MTIQEYWNNITDTENIDRGIYILFPLRYEGNFNQTLNIKDTNLPRTSFVSSDFTELLSVKCSSNDFVERFNLNGKLSNINNDLKEAIQINNIYQIKDLQLFVFNNGIAFLSVYFAYKNKDIDVIYDFINPGYIVDKYKHTDSIHELLLNAVETYLFDFLYRKLNLRFSWFIQDGNSRKYIIKEAYRLNVAAIPNRFENNEIPKRIAYNEHRLIDLTRDFTDVSEKDVEYTTGAKDVDDEYYGWGCAITSQEISYAYGPGPRKDKPVSAEGLLSRSEDDLLLTILVMYQKYTCMLFNEKIHNRYANKNEKAQNEDSLRVMKKEVLEFISYGTLAPSQVSRWNNVCETYRSLQKLTGVNEALEEISQKIDLLNDEQDHIDSQRESRIGMLITIFGIISIVSSSLQMLDYLSTGRPLMVIGFITSTIVIFFFLYYVIKKGKKEY